MNTKEQVRARIESKGVRSGDIKIQGRLTDDEIATIPVEHVYEWVRTGQWKYRDFKRWLKVLCVIE